MALFVSKEKMDLYNQVANAKGSCLKISVGIKSIKQRENEIL